MKLNKKVMSTALMVFMVMAIMSVAIVLPVLSQTVSVELVKVWLKWKKLKLSEHPYQILYAKAKSVGNEPVYVRVKFGIYIEETGSTLSYWSNEMFLPKPPPANPVKLECTLWPRIYGHYWVRAILYYSTDRINWLVDGLKESDFTVLP